MVSPITSELKEKIDELNTNLNQIVKDFYEEGWWGEEDIHDFIIHHFYLFNPLLYVAYQMAYLDIYHLKKMAEVVQTFMNAISHKIEPEKVPPVAPKEFLEMVLSLKILYSFILHYETIVVPEPPKLFYVTSYGEKGMLNLDEFLEIAGDEEALLKLPKMVEFEWKPTDLMEMFGTRLPIRKRKTHFEIKAKLVADAERLEQTVWNVGGLLTYFFNPDYICEIAEMVGSEMFRFFNKYVESTFSALHVGTSMISPEIASNIWRSFVGCSIGKDLIVSNGLVVGDEGGSLRVKNFILSESPDSTVLGYMISTINEANRVLPPRMKIPVGKITKSSDVISNARVVVFNAKYAVDSVGIDNIRQHYNGFVPLYGIAVIHRPIFSKEIKRELVSKARKILEKYI